MNSSGDRIYRREDIKNIKKLLKSLNITRYDDKVVSKLLGLCEALTIETVKQSVETSRQVENSNITPETVQFLDEREFDMAKKQIPPKEILLNQAEKRNQRPFMIESEDEVDTYQNLPPAYICMFNETKSYEVDTDKTKFSPSSNSENVSDAECVQEPTADPSITSTVNTGRTEGDRESYKSDTPKTDDEFEFSNRFSFG
ncbi:hypothetical protein RF11_04197 [Thelohanellus kitauei]|uniref:Uncharacterized protein n=1 Tax=Thelohanellus kitauei TaxID=669202 RepID=A0A0C2N671_THEKT|nr:hypothetical protein RF11_04197 [Thelohanellus kitauei]